MRRPLVMTAVLVCGCADILGIQRSLLRRRRDQRRRAERLAGGRRIGSDAPNEGGAGCGTCTTNGAGCEVLACHQDTPTAVTTNGTRVVWANSSPAASSTGVFAAPVAGGATTSVFAASSELPGLATLGNDSYVTTFSAGNVVWLPSDGSAGKAIDTMSFSQAINVDPLHNLLVYSSFANNGGVYMCAPNPPNACTGYEAVPNRASVQGVAIDQNNVYFSTTTGTAGVYACAWQAQCNSPTMLDASPSPTLVTVDGTYVYWVDDTFSSATIWRANKSDGTAKQSIATVGASILGFVVDSGSVYYAIADSKAGKVVRVKNDGTNSTDIATGLKTAAGVAVDATHVYFTEWGRTSIAASPPTAASCAPRVDARARLLQSRRAALARRARAARPFRRRRCPHLHLRDRSRSTRARPS